MKLVLLSFFVTRIIEVAVVLVRYTFVIFLDATAHFLIKVFLKLLGVGQGIFGIGVLRLQVLNYFFILSISKPEIVVCTGMTMNGHFVRNDLRNRWFHLIFFRCIGFARS